MAAAAQLEIARPQFRPARFWAEFDLLLACCGRSAEIPLTSPTDWERVLRLAEHHRVMPAVTEALCGRDDVPGSIQSALRVRFQKNAVKCLRFCAELARITRAFANAGIDVLAHKGPALAQVLYGDAALRQFADLDLLVRPRDVGKAKGVLRELGYESQRHLTSRQERAHLRSGHEHVFRLNDQRNLLELQWQILQRHYAIGFDVEAMFLRSRKILIEGFPVSVLGPEDLFLTLCVHAAKHSWEELSMVRDIAKLATLRLDWNWIWAEAARIGVVRIIVAGVQLARILLGCIVPDGMAGMTELHAATAVAQRLALRLSASREADIDSLRYYWELACLRERWRDRLRFVSRLACTPSVGEWESVELPDSFFLLYRFVRIGRLIKRMRRNNG